MNIEEEIERKIASHAEPIAQMFTNTLHEELIARNVWRELAGNMGRWTSQFLDRRAAVLTPGTAPAQAAVASWMNRVKVLCSEHRERRHGPTTDTVFAPWHRIMERQDEDALSENQCEGEARVEEMVESCAVQVEKIATRLTKGMNLERFEAARRVAWWATRDPMHRNTMASTLVGLSGGLERARRLDQMPRRHLNSIETLSTWARFALFAEQTKGSINPSVLTRPPEQWIRALIEEGARQIGVIAGRRPNARRIARTERHWRWGGRVRMAPPYAAILGIAETGKSIDNESGYGAALTLEKAGPQHTATMHREAIDHEAQCGQRRIEEAIKEKALENIARWAPGQKPERTLEVLQRAWNETVQRHGAETWLRARNGKGRAPYIGRTAELGDTVCSHWTVPCDSIARIFAAHDDIEEASKDREASARLQISMGADPVLKQVVEKDKGPCPTWKLAAEAMERTKKILEARTLRRERT